LAFDEVFLGSVERVVPDLHEAFDLVICADVLEHLVNPRSVLRDLATVLDGQGVLVASIPNIRHYRALARIVCGRAFSPDLEGVFDATHLRFFTRGNIDEMLHAAGLRPLRWGAPPPHRVRDLQRMLRRGPLAEYLTYQWFVAATPLRAGEPTRSHAGGHRLDLPGIHRRQATGE
jgi:SAM-dependent methyltransferase